MTEAGFIPAADAASIPTGDVPKTVADILAAAADLIDKPGAWTQDTFARDASGKRTGLDDPDATCFCVAGAILRIEGKSYRAWNVFDAYTRKRGFRHMADFNDQGSQFVVVAALRAAAEKARTDASHKLGGDDGAAGMHP